jgi:hypothetical protein
MQIVALDATLPANIAAAFHSLFEIGQYVGLGGGAVVVLWTLISGLRKDVQKRRQAWDDVIGVASIMLSIGLLSSIINWILTALGIGSYMPHNILTSLGGSLPKQVTVAVIHLNLLIH